MKKTSRILVTGASGLAGSAVLKELSKQGYTDIIGVSSKELRHGEFLYENGEFDLRYKENINKIFKEYSPEYVFNTAGHVGGINANNIRSAEFIYNNILIQTNVIHACHKYDVSKLLTLGSSCIYPRNCPQPIKEEYLLTGPLEKTNIGYAVAKIAGITLCDMYRKQYGCNFISVMPTNLYGPKDNWSLEDSHVLPGLMRKFHLAKLAKDPVVVVWGSGTPRREFLHVEDLARALVMLMEKYEEEGPINVGYGSDIRIQDLVELMAKIVGYEGQIIWDGNRPDGTPQKLLDSSRVLALGWKPEIMLEDGIKTTYEWLLNNYDSARL